MESDNQPMNEDSKGALRQCLPQLCDSMQTTKLLTWMESKTAFADIDIQKIEAKSTQYEKNKEFITLLKAKNQKAFDAFIECLWKTGQQHLSTEVLDKLDDRAYAAELLRGCPSQREPVGTTNERDIEKIRKVLKDIYLQRFKMINPFSLPFTFDIENTWVSLALREDSKHSQATEDHADLLKKAFEKEKMLVIEGKPATGKTSLMRRLAYEWAKGEQKLSHYDLVVYAEFREVREQVFDSIADLMLEYNKSFIESDEFEDIKSFLRIKKYSEQQLILLLLDGYDESTLDKQCKELNEYFTSTTISKKLIFNTVLTTRPGYLTRYRGNIGRYIFADVLGFTTIQQKESYVKNHFKSAEAGIEENIEAVHQLLQKNKNMNTLAETPLFLTFICLVHERIHDGTVLELYCNTLWWLIDRHQKDFPDRDIPSLFEYQGDLGEDKFETIQEHYHQFPQLHYLGKMGLHNLKKDLFSKSDYIQFGLKDILQQVGLLRKERTRERLKLITSFFFPHRTIQEFLGALYFFCFNEEIDLSLYDDTISNSTLDTSKMTEHQSFLLQIALCDGLSIVPAMRKIYFERITGIRMHLSFHAFNTVNGLNKTLINSLFSQCKNVRRVEMFSDQETTEQNSNRRGFRSNYIQKDSSSSSKISDPLLLTVSNLLHLNSIIIIKCTLKADFELSFRNCPVLKNISFNSCQLQSSKIDLTQLQAFERLEFVECTLKATFQLSVSNCASFKDLNFNRCRLQTCIIDLSQLPLFKTLNLIMSTFEAISQLSAKNCQALKHMMLRDCKIKGSATFEIAQLKAVDTLEFYDCTIDVKAWQSLTEEISNSSIKCLKLEFRGEEFNKGHVNQLQKCNNVIIDIEIDKYTIMLNDHLSFGKGVNFHSVTFHRCSFEDNSQLSFKNCLAVNNLKLKECDIKHRNIITIGSNAIDTLILDNCNIDLEAWESITEEIRNSSIKHLKLSFKGKAFSEDYINELEKCNNVIVEVEIYEYSNNSNDHLSFNNVVNLHSLTFLRCSSKANTQFSFTKCQALKNMMFHGCRFQKSRVDITKLSAIDSLKFYYCTFNDTSQFSFTNCQALKNISFNSCQLQITLIDLAILPAIERLEFVQCTFDVNFQLSFKNCHPLKYVKFYKCILESSIFDFIELPAVDSLKFADCTFDINSQLSFTNCQALKNMVLTNCEIKRGTVLGITQLSVIDTFEFYGCTINPKPWQSITEEIRNSSVKCLKFTPECSKYLEPVQKCNKIKEIYVVNHWTEAVEYYEYYTVQHLIKLAKKLQSLASIAFDFTNKNGELDENYKQLIEKAGQKRNPTFKVSIIPFKPSYERYHHT